MEWGTAKTGGVLVGRPVGRVDELSWESFLAEITAAIDAAAEDRRDFVLDLSGIDYMSSRGLRVLTLAKRHAESKPVAMALAKPNERMREILAISRYDKIFPVRDTLGD